MKKRISILLVVAMLINIVCSFSIVSAADAGANPEILLFGGTNFDKDAYGIPEYIAGEEPRNYDVLDNSLIVNVAMRNFGTLADLGLTLKYDPTVLALKAWKKVGKNYTYAAAVTGDITSHPAAWTGVEATGTLSGAVDTADVENGIIVYTAYSSDNFKGNGTTNNDYVPVVTFVFDLLKTEADVTADALRIGTLEEMKLAGGSKVATVEDSVYYTAKEDGVKKFVKDGNLDYTIDINGKVLSSSLATEAEPTEAPTSDPTAEPTEYPTEEPTAEPTDAPTAEPTDEPTAEPTDEPTAEPTDEPTAEPTDEPTAEPTEAPATEVPSSDARLNPNNLFFVSGIDNVQPSEEEGIDYTAEALDGFANHVLGARALDVNATVYNYISDEYVDPTTIAEDAWTQKWYVTIPRMDRLAVKYVNYKVVAQDGETTAYYVVKFFKPAKAESAIRSLFIDGFKDIDDFDAAVVVDSNENGTFDADEYAAAGATLEVKSLTWNKYVIQAIRKDLEGSTVEYKLGTDFGNAEPIAKYKKAILNLYYKQPELKNFEIGDKLFVECTAEDGVTTSAYVFNIVK